MDRPKCFEFAMGFLGGKEEAAIRQYISELEDRWQVIHPKKKEPDPRYATADDLIKLWEQVRDTEGHLEYFREELWWKAPSENPGIGSDLNRWRVIPKEKQPLEVWVNEYSPAGNSSYYGRAHSNKKDAQKKAEPFDNVRTIHFVEVNK